MIYKLKSKGTFYNKVDEGKAKFDGTWYDAVYYKRLPVNLEEGECVKTLYCRTREDFNQSFDELTMDQLQKEIG